MHRDLLIEIGCEELPPASLHTFQQVFAQQLTEQLQAADFAYADAKSYASPRRLALVISEVVVQQADKSISRRGPNVKIAFDPQGQPTQAALGFARSCGMAVDSLTQVEQQGQKFINAEFLQAGQPLAQLLPAMVEKALISLPIPKLMRWGDGDRQFVRPVHWLVMLLGDEVVNGEVLAMPAGKITFGHRFHCPQPIILSQPKQYAEQLQATGFVLADPRQRQARIVTQLTQAAEKLGGRCVMPSDLVEMVTAIVEWPVVLTVPFSPRFLTLPREVLMTSMATHQKCFMVEAVDGELLPHCLVVANIESRQPQRVIDGNARVIHARLSDAEFFYQQDSQQSLAGFQAGLSQVVFQEKLGTLADKTQRVKDLMQRLSIELALDPEQSDRAATLSKCSLLTAMVGEFPELQDVMGCAYAQRDGESHAVAVALKEQYWPRFSGDHLPQTLLGKALAVADRIDTLVGIIGIGQKPSAEKDPFQLRRLALGVIRILMTVELDCHWLIEQAMRQFADGQLQPDCLFSVMQFIHDRLTVYLRQHQGVSVDRIQAVLKRQPYHFADLQIRLSALNIFVDDRQGTDLIRIAKRVRHMLKSPPDDRIIQPNLFENALEQTLYDGLQALIALRQTVDYPTYFQHCLQCVPAIDGFFDGVMIQVEAVEVRQNRLALLSAVDDAINAVVAFDLVQQESS